MALRHIASRDIFPSAHIRTSPSAALIALALMAPTLSACGGGGSTTPMPPVVTPPAPTLPTGADRGGTGAATDPLAAFTTTASFTTTAQQGYESATLSGASSSSVALGTSANSSTKFDRTTTGFNLTYTKPFGTTIAENTVPYDTRAGSGHRGSTFPAFGNNEYESCNNTTCIGAQGGPPHVRTQFTSGAASTLSYSTYGVWSEHPFVLGTVAVGAFATGLPSTSTQVPTTGTATFNGGAAGFVMANSQDAHRFKGNITLNADFTARTIGGSITGITTERLTGTAQTGTLGNISLNGGTMSGAAFTGVANGNALTTGVADISTMTGRFGGQFYGPNAQEVAGSFALTGNGLGIIGSFGAKR